jgi:hypothetical protein
MKRGDEKSHDNIPLNNHKLTKFLVEKVYFYRSRHYRQAKKVR